MNTDPNSDLASTASAQGDEQKRRREADIVPDSPSVCNSDTQANTTHGGTGLPLDGIRVLEVAQILAGPYTASILGDLGAEVIKIEPPMGDALRATDNLLGEDGSAYFASINRNKRYLTLDLKDEGDRYRFEQIIETSEVFITNLRPSAAEDLRLGYEEMCKLKPDLIYCWITGFGESGPRCNEPGMDIIAQAISGVMSVTGENGGPPLKAGPPVADFAAALYAVSGILAAIIRKRQFGVGSRIGVNLLDASLAMISNYVPQVAITGKDIIPVGNGHPQLVPYRAFEAADGRYFIVGILTDKFWSLLCNAVAPYANLNRNEFATNALRVQNRKMLDVVLEGIFKLEPAQYWIDLLGKVGIPVCPVNTITEALRDEQVIHNRIAYPASMGRGAGKQDYVIIGNPLTLDGKRLPMDEKY